MVENIGNFLEMGKGITEGGRVNRNQKYQDMIYYICSKFPKVNVNTIL